MVIRLLFGFVLRWFNVKWMFQWNINCSNNRSSLFFHCFAAASLYHDCTLCAMHCIASISFIAQCYSLQWPWKGTWWHGMAWLSHIAVVKHDWQYDCTLCASHCINAFFCTFTQCYSLEWPLEGHCCCHKLYPMVSHSWKEFSWNYSLYAVFRWS